jgi:predicted RecA/RadA family phage recombinase
MATREAYPVSEGFIISITAPAAYAGGEVIKFGNGVGIVQSTCAQGEVVALAIAGLYRFPAKSTDDIGLGAPLYWDEANRVATVDSNSGANPKIGPACAEKIGGASGTIEALVSWGGA